MNLRTVTRVILVLGSGLVLTNVTLADPFEHRNEVARRLSGVMVATIVREGKPTVKVEMTTCPVQVTAAKASDSVFLYQEQGIVGNLDKPYRQRFLEIVSNKTNDQEVVLSHSYKPDNLAAWVNYCQKTDKIPIPRATLGNLVCMVTLQPYLNLYVGKTPPEGCPVNLRGAVKVTNRIFLTEDGMETWDRGYNTQGDRVWGAEDEAYRFFK